MGDFYDDPHQGPAEGLQVQAGDQPHVSEQVESGKLTILIDELLGCLLCQDGIKQTGTGWGGLVLQEVCFTTFQLAFLRFMCMVEFLLAFSEY